jgi:ArsR family transcriptional regulator, arsenate/arsenite/antimonite-responsive transcriptional repressor
MNSVFKALHDPTRRQILEMLHVKDMTAGEIADAFTISKPSISHHLDLLKQANLVVAIKEGQFMRYSLNTSVFEDVMGWLIGFTQEKKTSKK